MEILKSLFRSIVRLVAINIVLILFFASAPLLYVTVPLWFLLTNHRDPADMLTVYMLTGPFACGFWMTVICHWHTVRKAQGAGSVGKLARYGRRHGVYRLENVASGLW